jgi:hypothetical protein
MSSELGHDAGYQAQMEAACKEKTGRTQSEIQKNVLATGLSFCPICIK